LWYADKRIQLWSGLFLVSFNRYGLRLIPYKIWRWAIRLSFEKNSNT
jgi:hypothetical protein